MKYTVYKIKQVRQPTTEMLVTSDWLGVQFHCYKPIHIVCDLKGNTHVQSLQLIL